MSVDDLARPDDQPVNLALLVAWLAARCEDEQSRLRCRLVAKAYLEWSWADGGPASTRDARFVITAARRLQLTRPQVEQALERLREHRATRAQTLPENG